MSHKLSLPRELTTEDDTFSKDLLRQFDKRRSRLHFELGFTSQEPSPESSRILDYYDQEPIQLDDEIHQVPTRQTQESSHYSQTTTSYQSNNTTGKRSVSASDLLRKSSAFLKLKFDSLKKNKSQGDQIIIDNNNIDNNTSPTKLLMKTTISIPSTTTATTTATARASSFSPVLTNPPTITQYPPKPLVYSPIDPIPTNQHSSKPLLHRISMPLLRVYNDTASISRHRSITSFGRRRKSEPDDHTKRKLRKPTTKQQ
ncbi:hypothetical protein EDC94DRAFT_524993 [Helicostylum pulchrum]|uniref:Uncharacterized protein n=1 Tax=Helicostylum pulchrum TaxID=562976 RepID=A0ABP9XR94_9FUNG|nr:hypothetical protein EDC94DRAFT_524993 [Helicostylum pulchrum]